MLDLAAGPGDTGFLSVPRLLPGGRLLSTDIAPEMVEAATRRAAELELPAESVTCGVEDATALSLADGSVDGALCRFGYMLVGDVSRAFAETARVLRPGCAVSFAVWAPAPENPFISSTARAALELGLMERPAPDAPGPFRLADVAELRGLVERAGLRVEVLEDVQLTWRTASLDDLWDVQRDVSRLLSLLLERLSSAEIDALRDRAFELLAPYVEAGGEVVAPGLARAVLARRPQ